jgi:uroporphyrinogen-III synthase
MRVVVTRPRGDAERTAARLTKAGHDPIVSPVLAIRATGATLPEGPFDAVIVTSANALPPRIADLPAALLSVPTHAVGEATARAARRAGFTHVSVGPGRGEQLAEALLRQRPVPERLLYLAGRDRTPDLEAALAASGLAPRVVEVYAAEPEPTLSCAAKAAFAGESGAAPGTTDSLVVLNYSARSAALFLALLDRLGLDPAQARHACLSEAVAQPLLQRRLVVLVATKPQEEALMRLLES